MSEHYISFLLEIDSGSIPKWELLIKGMCNGELGAYFEERIEGFGEAAIEIADTVLDEWYEFNNPPRFDDYKRKSSQITFVMIDGLNIIHRTELMVKLLKICGAKTTISSSSLEDR